MFLRLYIQASDEQVGRLMLICMALKSKVLPACLTLPTEIAVIFKNTIEHRVQRNYGARFKRRDYPSSSPGTFRLVAFNSVLAKWIAVLSDGLQSQLQIILSWLADSRS
jgi:hypothetical protein